MAYKVIILYRLYMPSYVLGTFTEYPILDRKAAFLLSANILFRVKFLTFNQYFISIGKSCGK